MALANSSYEGKNNRKQFLSYGIIAVLIIVILIIIFAGGENKNPSPDVAANKVDGPNTTAADTSVAGDGLGLATETSAEAKALIESANKDLAAKPRRIIDARDKFNEAMSLPLSESHRKNVKEKMTELSDEWLFSRSIFPKDMLCESYHVQPGELFSQIGRRYKVPPEILMYINSITDAKKLRAGQRIKIIKGPFRAVIKCSDFEMDVYLQDTYVKTYGVGLGQEGRDTPAGLWEVRLGGKLEHPDWTDQETGRTYRWQDEDYPLGSRYIALDGIEGPAKDRTGFALHGTKDANSIGTLSSRGCIRLHNGDAIMVYNMLTPKYSIVEIFE